MKVRSAVVTGAANADGIVRVQLVTHKRHGTALQCRTL